MPIFSVYIEAPLFDFIQDDGTPIKANGYRSLLYVLKELLSHLLSHLQKHAKERGNVFYSSADALSNITAYTRAMQVKNCSHCFRFSLDFHPSIHISIHAQDVNLVNIHVSSVLTLQLLH